MWNSMQSKTAHKELIKKGRSVEDRKALLRKILQKTF